MDVKEQDLFEQEILENVQSLIYWGVKDVVVGEREMLAQIQDKIPYSESSLINLTNGQVSSSGHLHFQLTKNNNGVDSYNMGIDSSPVKAILSQEGGVYRSAMVLSDTATTGATSFGVSTSDNNGVLWQPRLVITNSGNVGIGKKNPAQKLDIIGNIAATGTVNGRNLITDGLKLDSMDAVKLNNIEALATRNDSDANLRLRATHTGTQLASTISDFDSAVSISSHAVNTDNPHNVTKAQLGLANVPNLKMNLLASSDPDASSDQDGGYSVGSFWYNTVADTGFVCMDASPAAAIWRNFTEGSLTSALNVGTGQGLFTQKSGNDLRFKSLTVGSNKLILSSNANEINLDVDSTKLALSTLIGAPSSTVVGITDVQTLTNKSISGLANTITNIGDDSLTAGINVTKLGVGSVNNTVFNYLAGLTSNVQTQFASKANSSHSHASSDVTDLISVIGSTIAGQKGIANGLATLDSGGKIPSNQIAIDGDLVYLGSWNASTNSPQINSGVGVKGQVYIVKISGNTVIDGQSEWAIGDSLIFDGTVWDKFSSAVRVNSVAGREGNVILTASDIASGTFANPRISQSSVLQYQSAFNILGLTGSPSSTVVGISDVQSLSNKTISTINNTITGIGTANLATGIDVSKLANGTVSNVQFQYLAGTTSNLQIQIDGKSTLGHVHSAADITSGTFADARISQSSVLQYETAFTIGNLIDAPTSTVVGTSDAQVLANKTIDATLNTVSNIGNGSLTAGLNVSKLSSGTVTNAEFDRLSGISSNIQTQLNSKSAIGHLHTAYDIISGTFADARISQSSVLQHQTALTLANLIGAPLSAVVGINDVQTLTNKTISPLNNTITGLGDVNLTAGINAAKLADGSVTNAQFQYLTGASSNLQIQIDGKAAAVHTHSTADVTSGTFADARISQSSVLQYETAFTLANLIGAPGSAVVGINDIQTLTNKTISPLNNTITGLGDANLTSGINVNKLANGTVSNIQFQHLAGVTSAIQAQLDGKAASIHTHSTADIISGTFADARISQSSVLQYQAAMTLANLIGAPGSAVVGINDVQTLTNKTISTANNTISGIGDAHLVSGINVNKLANGTVSNIQFQHLAGVTSAIQTQINSKAAFSHTHSTADINSGTFADARISQSSVLQYEGAFTLSNLIGAPGSAVVGINDLQTLTNKSLDISSTVFFDNTIPTKTMGFQTSGSAANTKTTLAFAQTANRTVTFPDVNDTLVGLTAVQTLSNKTLTTPVISQISNTGTLTLPTTSDTLVGRATADTLTNKNLSTASCLIVDGTVSSKTVGFAVSGATPLTRTTLAFTQTTNRTITFPNATDTLVALALAQTLTNKTISGTNNTLTNIGSASLSAGIDAVKIADGTISNAEFQYLNGVTSNIQTQLNGKATSNHTHTSNGITDFDAAVDSRITLQKAQVNGLATLDGTGKIPADQLSMAGALQYQGNWNASTNTPTITSSVGTSGFFYIVTTAGNITIDGVTNWQIGDWIIFDTAWTKVSNSNLVTSVAGRTGAIVLTAADIGSGTFADARIAQSSILQHQSAITLGNLIGAPASAVVGISSTQTLTNKTISAASNTITGLTNASIATGAAIDAAKLGDGIVTVTNTEFGYLAGVSSAIQSQLNSKAASAHTHAASDITSGTFADARISQSSVLQHQAAMTLANLIGAPASAVVGITDIQSLTNKTINGLYNSFTNIDNTALVAGIDAAKIGTGIVTNSTFGYLANATSNIQTQLNAKAASSHTHSTADINSGTFADARIAQTNVTQHQGAINILSLTGSPNSAVVGISSTQTLTNKSIDAATNTLTNIADASIAVGAAINASKIGAGTVTTTQFGYLSGVTSAIQAQLDAKAAVVHTHAASDINFGTFADARIALSNITQHYASLNLLSMYGAPDSTIAGISTAQTLTNKTIDSATNTVTADKLRTATGTVTINTAAAPTAGQILTATNGAAASWENPATQGTVTSVGLSVPSEFTVSNSPITSSGTLTINKANQSPALVYAGASKDIVLGNSTLEATDDSNNGGLLLATSYTLSQAATVISLSFYVATAGGDLRLGIYSDNGTGSPAILQAFTPAFTPTLGWNTIPVTTPISLNAGIYWLAYLPQSNSLHFNLNNTTGTTKYYSCTYGALPANWSLAGNTSITAKWSFYANFVIAGLAGAPGFRSLTYSDMPDLKSQYCDLKSHQLLYNKILDNAGSWHADTTDNSKRFAYNTSGSSSATTLTFATNQTTSQSLTIPNISSGDNLMTTGTIQTVNGQKVLSNVAAIMNRTLTYATGTISQTSTTVTGVGTSFTAAMVGGCIIFNNGSYGYITAVASGTSLTVAQNQTISSQSYSIYYGGFQVDNLGNTGMTRTIVSASAASSRPLTVIAASGQTSNLTEWQNSSNVAKAIISPAGDFDTASSTVRYRIAGNIVLQSPVTTSILVGNTGNTAGGTLGVNNTFGGVNAGKLITTSHNNTLFGYNAGAALTTTGNSNWNTMVGSNAGWQCTGDSNTLFGESAGYGLTTGTNNVAIGEDSLNAGGPYTGSYNTLCGMGTSLSAGNVSSATVFGYAATAASGGIALGWSASAATNELAVRSGSGSYILKSNGTTLTLPNSTSTLTLGTNVMTFPTATDTIVGLTSPQTLTNKTLTAPVISQISNTGLLTLPTSTDTLIGRATSDLLSNKSLTFGSTVYATGTISQSASTITGIGTTFLPTMVGGLIVFADGTHAFVTAFNSTTSLAVTPSQTVSSQSFNLYYNGLQFDKLGNLGTTSQVYLRAGATSIIDATDPSKRFNLALNSSSAATTLTLNLQQTTTQTLSIPNLTSADTMVVATLAQSLNNKTLVTPTISSILNGGTLTLPSGTDTLIGRATTDTFTNKTATSNTNNIIARGLWYNSGAGSVSTYAAGTPSAGQVLTIVDSNTATWQFPAGSGINSLNGLTTATQTFAIGSTGSDFNISSTTSTHTFNIPDAGAGVRGFVTAAAQTFAGVKTFSSAPVFSSITNTGTLTLPTTTDTLVGRATTDTFTNKSLNNTNCFHVDATTATKRIGFACSASTASTTLTLAAATTANRTITFPDATDTVTTLAATQNLTNKTLSNNTNNIVARGLWYNSGAGSVSTYAAAAPTAGQILTIVDANTATWQSPSGSGVTTLNGLTTATQSFAIGSTGTDFNISSTTSTHTFNIPSASAAARGLVSTGAQTFAGVKTFSAAPVFSSITNGAATLTLPTATDTILGRATTDILSNKTLTADNCLLIDGVDTTKKIQFNLNGLSTATTRTITIPNVNDTLVTLAATQTLSNKTFIAGSCFYNDDIDSSKRLGYSISNNSTGATLTISTQQTSSKVLAIPNINANDSLVTADSVQTIANKTLTTAVLGDAIASQVVVTDGSKNLTSMAYTASNTPSTIVQRDANANIAVGNINLGYTTTPTADGITTLTVASNFQQFFTGAANHTLRLPVVSTLVLGLRYAINNNSTGSLTVQSSGANSIVVIPGGAQAILTCILTSGTTAASWDYVLTSPPGTITYSEISATATASTSSLTYVVIAGLTTTPPAGTYMVSFSASGASNTTTVTANYAIHNGGAVIQHSERNLGTSGGGQTNNYEVAMHTQAVVTVNGSQAIDVRYKIGGGAFSVYGRSIALIKLT